MAESIMDRLMEVRPEPATQKSRVLQADSSRRRNQGGVCSGQHEASREGQAGQARGLCADRAPKGASTQVHQQGACGAVHGMCVCPASPHLSEECGDSDVKRRCPRSAMCTLKLAVDLCRAASVSLWLQVLQLTEFWCHAPIMLPLLKIGVT